MEDIINTTPDEATRQHVEAAVVQWRAKREERLQADHVASELKKQEVALKNWLITTLLAQRYEGVVVDNRITSLADKEVAQCNNREEFSAYILEQQDLSLLEFRPAKGALKERQKAGEEVPGIEWVTVYDLSDRKAT